MYLLHAWARRAILPGMGGQESGWTSGRQDPPAEEGTVMYRFFVTILNPFLLLHLAIGASLVNLWLRRRDVRRGLLAVAIPFGLLCLLEMPLLKHLALGS